MFDPSTVDFALHLRTLTVELGTAHKTWPEAP